MKLIRFSLFGMAFFALQSWASPLVASEWYAVESESDVRIGSTDPSHVLFAGHVISLVPVVICRNGSLGISVTYYGDRPESELDMFSGIAFAINTESRQIISDTIWVGDGEGEPADLIVAEFIRVILLSSGERASFIADARGLAEVAFQYRDECGL